MIYFDSTWIISMKIKAFIICFILVISHTAEADQNSISVNYPPDNAIMEFSLLSISLNVPKDSASLIKVSVNDKEQAAIIPDSEFECLTVPLAVGINSISITAIKNNKPSDSIFINIFRRSELEVKYSKPPSEFQKRYFHSEDRSLCKDCHTLVPSETDRKPVNIAAFPDRELKGEDMAAAATSTCYSCHKAILSYPFIHGPAAVWSCLSCHDSQAEPMYAVRKPDTKVCFNCHIEEKEAWNSRKYFHGPYSTGKCAICHNPHASDFPYNLVKYTWDLCMSCHVDKGSGRHIVAGYVNENQHPTRGTPDPINIGKELSCASCHNSHASDSPKLWRLNVGSGFELCRMCHAE